MQKSKSQGIVILLSLIIAGSIFYFNDFFHGKSDRLKELKIYINSTKSNDVIDCSDNVLANPDAAYKLVTNEIIISCPDSSMYNRFFRNNRSHGDNLNHFLNFIIFAINKFPGKIINVEQNNHFLLLTNTISVSENITFRICFIKEENKFKVISISDIKDLLLFLDAILKLKNEV